MDLSKATILRLVLGCCLSAAALLLTPSEAQAGCFCGSTVYTTEPTTGTWGLGADCAAARSDLINQLNAAIHCVDGTCSVQLEIKTECYFEPMKGMYREDGVYHYTCLHCFDPDPRDPPER